jgi:hypothetical protein
MCQYRYNLIDSTTKNINNEYIKISYLFYLNIKNITKANAVYLEE